MAVSGFLLEVKRRKVFRVALVYSGVAWLLLQLADVITEPLGLPIWFVTLVLSISALGFPLAIILSWVFDVSPGGIERSSTPDLPEHSLSLSQWLQVAIILVLVLSVGYLYLDRLQLQRQVLDANTPIEHVANNEPSTIAVLPFVDMSAEGDQQYFGNGIAEEILNALVAVDGLQVAARTSSFSFLNANTPITDIGSTLGVKHILEGSIRQSGERIRITAQLIDVSSGFHLFSQTYERRLEDVFEIQNEIASEIVTALLPHMGVEETAKLVKQDTHNLEAHKLRLRARHTFYSDTGKIRESVALLQEVIELDPQYWAAWGDLSYAYGYHSFLEADPLPILMRAQQAFSITLANDPGNVPALLMKAYLLTLFDGEHVEIMELYQRAKDLGTDSTYWAYNIAWLYLAPQGRFDEAIEILELAKLKDPLAFMPRNALAVINLAAGKISEAGKNVQELLTMPDMPAAAFMDVGRALIAAGGVRKAEELLATIGPARVGEVSTISNTRIEYYRATNQLDALRDLLALFLAHRGKGEYVYPTVVANIYIALQDYDAALDWLAGAVDARDPQFLVDSAVYLRRHPVVGKDPRFITLLRRMNLAE